jgi:hypothetical protein
MEGQTEKLYCYVDETGQDTKGKFFIVSVVIAKNDRDEIVDFLELLEKQTKKYNRKWLKTPHRIKIAYIASIFQDKRFTNKIFYHRTKETLSYIEVTLNAIASSIDIARQQKKYKAAIFIDGLSRPSWRKTGSELRKRGILTEKIRGVEDESHALIRLADAVAGLVREQVEGREFAKELCGIGVKHQTLRPISVSKNPLAS